MDIVGKARKLERKIARSLDAAVQEFVGRSTLSPLEVVHDVLDRAERQVQESGRGRRVFPFNRVTVHLVAAPRDHETKARFAAVFDGPPPLVDRLRDRLESAGCRVADLSVTVAYASKAAPHWSAPEFDVQFERAAPAPAPPAPSTRIPQIKVTVLNGKAGHRNYEFTGGRIDVGRRTEILDAQQRLVRTNHIAFVEEGPDPNRSVSRRHAHIAYVPGEGHYRVCDDRSVHGTSIVREGKTTPVPPGTRGVRLKSGDEILLGQVRLKVTIESA